MTGTNADLLVPERRERLQVETFPVLGTPIARITMSEAIDQVNAWAQDETRGRAVTFVNVHMLVEARQHPEIMAVLQGADLNLPDGTPLYWIGRNRFKSEITQVAGPDFMPLFCAQGLSKGYRHFLYGGLPGVVDAASSRLEELLPGIEIAGVYAPPFRPLTEEEDEEVCRRINESGADFLWVCLGCPKQEVWIHEHRDRLNVKVLFGVGQAIDILAGNRVRAPQIVRQAGMEWFFRLVREPRRLWRRYFLTNFLFIYWITQEWLFPQKSL